VTATRRKPRRLATRVDPVLVRLGERVRNLRAIRGMSRKALAHDARVSERFLADLESGTGNASILLLKRLADALALPLAELVDGEREQRGDLQRSLSVLARLPAARLAEAQLLLESRFAAGANDARRGKRIALIGLRGAGKSTLGRGLATALGYRFVELDETIERLSGMDTAQIHGMLGQSAYRRYELQALEEVVDSGAEGVVIATPGSIVSEADTFRFLLEHCHTIWIKASPEEHMARVIAQGDLRPMAGNREAMDDLRRILANREPLYSQADGTIDTAGRTTEESLEELRGELPVAGSR